MLKTIQWSKKFDIRRKDIDEAFEIGECDKELHQFFSSYFDALETARKNLASVYQTQAESIKQQYLVLGEKPNANKWLVEKIYRTELFDLEKRLNRIETYPEKKNE